MNKINIFEKPREKLVTYGPSSLSNEELVAIMLGSGTKENDVFQISKKTLNFLEESIWLFKKDFAIFLKRLSKIKGLGIAKASLLAASIELYSRLVNEKGHTVKSVKDIIPFISYLTTKRQEYFVCINLNGGNRVISSRVVTIGLVDQALVHPREVFAEAVKERAAKVVVAHNHPGGGLSPSSEDVQITKNLVKASSILGIVFLDHIIVSEDGYFSFREEGLL